MSDEPQDDLGSQFIDAPGEETVSIGGGVRLRCFARFAGAIVPDENYRLYHLSRN